VYVHRSQTRVVHDRGHLLNETGSGAIAEHDSCSSANSSAFLSSVCSSVSVPDRYASYNSLNLS